MNLKRRGEKFKRKLKKQILMSLVDEFRKNHISLQEVSDILKIHLNTVFQMDRGERALPWVMIADFLARSGKDVEIRIVDAEE